MNKYTSFIVIAVLVILGVWFLKGSNKSPVLENTDLYDITTAIDETTQVPVKENTIINNIDNKEEVKKMTKATLHTNMGDIEIEFFEQDAPKTVENFLKLAKEGFYDGVKFHRVIKDFMIQTGDPNSKDDTKMSLWGQGGPGYTVPAEIKIKHTRGTVATARLSDQVNPSKASSGSQFFINVADNAFLDGGYTVFGKVVAGMDVVDFIQNVETVEKGSADRPVKAIIINSITLK